MTDTSQAWDLHHPETFFTPQENTTGVSRIKFTFWRLKAGPLVQVDSDYEVSLSNMGNGLYRPPCATLRKAALPTNHYDPHNHYTTILLSPRSL